MVMVFLMMELLQCMQMLEDVDLGLNIPATIPIAAMEFIVMAIGVAMMERWIEV